MTIGTGQQIDASDYNSLVSFIETVIFGNGGGPAYLGYGQPTSVPIVNNGEIISETQWRRIQNRYSAAVAYQQNPQVTNLGPNPQTGTIITGGWTALQTAQVPLMNLAGWSAYSGPQYVGWTGLNSKQESTNTGFSTITFDATVLFGSYDQARYFFNAGGRIKIEFAKSSTGQQGDADWNNLANNVMSDLYVVSGGTLRQTSPNNEILLQGQFYQGFDRIGGTGTPGVYVRNAGWYDLIPGAAFVKVYQQNSPNVPYNNNYIEVFISKNAAQTQLNIRSIWTNSEGDAFSGGTPPSGATPGTAPCMIVTYFPPGGVQAGFFSTASWGTPLVNSVTTWSGTPIPPAPPPPPPVPPPPPPPTPPAITASFVGPFLVSGEDQLRLTVTGPDSGAYSYAMSLTNGATFSSTQGNPSSGVVIVPTPNTAFVSLTTPHPGTTVTVQVTRPGYIGYSSNIFVPLRASPTPPPPPPPPPPPAPPPQVKVVIAVTSEGGATDVGIGTTSGDDWEVFKRRNPGVPFYVMKTPYRTGILLPPTFTPANLGYGPVPVNNDNGNPGFASDWFALNNLQQYGAGTWVYYAIYTGNINGPKVPASVNLLIQRCLSAGMIPIARTMNKDDWIKWAWDLPAPPVPECGPYPDELVTARISGGYGIAGDNPYTATSDMSVAVVHAGLAVPGQVVTVQKFNAARYAIFNSTVANGVTSSAAGPGCGVQIRLAPSPGRIFDQPGSYDFTVPPGVTRISVLITGGGGGAGGSANLRLGANGVSGYRIAGAMTVTPGETMNVIVGAGGRGGADNRAGGAGGASAFAPGGRGGDGNGNGSGGGGGGASVIQSFLTAGRIICPGGPGGGGAGQDSPGQTLGVFGNTGVSQGGAGETAAVPNTGGGGGGGAGGAFGGIGGTAGTGTANGWLGGRTGSPGWVSVPGQVSIAPTGANNGGVATFAPDNAGGPGRVEITW